MRTLLEIIESAKNGEKPGHDECYYAMLALSYLHNFDWQDMLKIHERATDEKNPLGNKFLAEESFNRTRKAMGVSPKEYLGSYDPANPLYQEQRRLAKKFFDKIEKESKSE